MIGNNITAFRKSLNISQRELGRRTGLSGQMISKIENNLANPSIETLQKIADCFGIKTSNLLSDIEEDDNINEFIKIQDLLEECEYEINSYIENGFNKIEIIDEHGTVAIMLKEDFINHGNRLISRIEDYKKAQVKNFLTFFNI